MSTDSRKRPRHRRRWLLVVAVLLFAGFVLSYTARQRSLRRSRRADRLITEIEQAGVVVSPGMPTWERLWSRIRGNGDYGTAVTLSGRTYSRNWLEFRNYLTDIEIADLTVTDATEFGDELTALVARHPIKSLTAPNANAADDIAKVLTGKSSLRTLELERSDLTDRGLAQLPLERLSDLNVALTDVTADGLRKLQRCHRLRSLTIDGRQLTTEIIASMEENGQLYTLTLVGPDVTDGSLKLLNDTRNMYILNLHETSVTKTAFDELARDVPTCTISVKPNFQF